MAKYLSDNQLLGHQGETLVKQLCLDIGCVFERVSVDSGIDGTIELRDPVTKEMLNLIVRARVKATENFASENAEAFSFTCEKADIEYWLKGNTPNILIVCRPSTKEAYWKSIRTWFSDPTNSDTNTVRFVKKEDRLDETARQKLFELSRSRESGLYMEAPRKDETLFANLFEVRELPQKIFSAATDCVSLKQVYAKGIDAGGKPPPEIVFSGGLIYSVWDPKTTPGYENFCDVATTEANTFADSFPHDEKASLGHASELLFKCFQGLCVQAGLQYRHDKNPKARIFIAPYVKIDSTSGQVSKQRRKFHAGEDKKTARLRSMVSPLDRKGTGKIRGLKHQAFHADFWYFEGKWFLQLSPTYFYSWDGVRRKKSSDRLLSFIKRRERNKAIFSNLRMWEEYFLDHDEADLIQKPYPHLRLGPLAYFPVGVGIPDDAWKEEAEVSIELHEDEQLLQSLLE